MSLCKREERLGGVRRTPRCPPPAHGRSRTRQRACPTSKAGFPQGRGDPGSGIDHPSSEAAFPQSDAILRVSARPEQAEMSRERQADALQPSEPVLSHSPQERPLSAGRPASESHTFALLFPLK